MRIVHAIARLNVGGAALSVLELAAGQQRLGHDVLVVAGTIPPGEASMEHLAETLGVPYRHLPELQRELSPRHDARRGAAIHRLLRERRPDVLHTHTAKAGHDRTRRRAASPAAPAPARSSTPTTVTCSAATSRRGASAPTASSSGHSRTRPMR